MELALESLGFKYREDHGAELWQEPNQYSAVELLEKVAKADNSSVVDELLRRLGESCMEWSADRGYVMLSLELLRRGIYH